MTPERTWHAPRGAPVFRCSACQASIAFAPTARGRDMPIDVPPAMVEPVDDAPVVRPQGRHVLLVSVGRLARALDGVPHWATCREPGRFRRGR